jgi:hypothetical protein
MAISSACRSTYFHDRSAYCGSCPGFTVPHRNDESVQMVAPARGPIVAKSVEPAEPVALMRYPCFLCEARLWLKKPVQNKNRTKYCH